MQSDLFKAAVGKFPTGVCVISTKYNNKHYGFTANSFTSVSLDPSLVSFCLEKKAGSFLAFLNSPHFIVNILSSEQESISKRFASSSTDKFYNLIYKENQNGIAMIPDALSYIECVKHKQIECGDHYIFIGQVIEATISDDMSDQLPLIYYGKNYRTIR